MSLGDTDDFTRTKNVFWNPLPPSALPPRPKSSSSSSASSLSELSLLSSCSSCSSCEDSEAASLEVALPDCSDQPAARRRAAARAGSGATAGGTGSFGSERGAGCGTVAGSVAAPQQTTTRSPRTARRALRAHGIPACGGTGAGTRAAAGARFFLGLGAIRGLG